MYFHSMLDCKRTKKACSPWIWELPVPIKDMPSKYHKYDDSTCYPVFTIVSTRPQQYHNIGTLTIVVIVRDEI